MNPGTNPCRNHGRSSRLIMKRSYRRYAPTTRTISSSAATGTGTRNATRHLRIRSRAHRTLPIRYTFTRRTHRQSLRDNGARALKNGVALFATEYGTSSASGGGAYDPAETELWWNWLDANHIGLQTGRLRQLSETSAAFQPGASAIGPWTDDMLKPSGLLVRNYIIGRYSPPPPLARPVAYFCCMRRLLAALVLSVSSSRRRPPTKM